METETWTEDSVLAEFRVAPEDTDHYQRAEMLGCDFLRKWFLERGYTTYLIDRDEYSIGYMPVAPTECADSDVHVCFPYACHGGDDAINQLNEAPLSAWYQGGIIFAQDAQQRHVAIKTVKDTSEECAVLRFLYEQGYTTSLDDFNHVIPVLDMLAFGEFWFVVMPRWGTSFNKPYGPTVKDVLKVVHSLLKGLAYLHKNRIAHGDISLQNIVVSHFGRRNNDPENPMRYSFKREGRLTYAFIDFEFSHKFPPSWSDKQCRLPCQLSWRGTFGYIPPDTSAGEFDYDPFARDVGSLGLCLSDIYDYLIPHVPMLAPLFDKMIMRDIPRRFTAAQALRLFEDEVYPRTTPAQLSRVPGPREKVSSDRWQALDLDFVKEWAAYRETPLPWTTKLLRWFCEYPYIFYSVMFIRKAWHTIRCAVIGT